MSILHVLGSKIVEFCYYLCLIISCKARKALPTTMAGRPCSANGFDASIVPLMLFTNGLLPHAYISFPLLSALYSFSRAFTLGRDVLASDINVTAIFRHFEINVTVATNAHARDLLRHSPQFETRASICSDAIMNIFTTVSSMNVKQLPIDLSR